MNERIRQLALEAFQPINDIASEGIADRHTFDQAWFQHYNEKFAELIVKECMNQVREQYLPVLEDELMMKDTHWSHYVQCGVDSYVAIKQHFGVEE